jgi:phospholipid/cholesterol/gamma-HCH transport system substrate-binding protein
VTARSLRLAAAGAAAAVTLTGCDLSQGLYGVSLPGSVGAGGYKVTAVFSDVSQLVPDAVVKVADVTVGTVTGVSLIRQHGRWMAKVVMHIEPSVHVPANSVAVLQETSLLGEKFVELGPPAGVRAARGYLPANGTAFLSADNTVAYPDLEQVFAALSLLLNGGGLQQLQTIDYQLSQALNGREANVRDLVTQLNTTLGGLNAQRGQIVRALDNLDALSTVLARQRDTIATALTDLAPGLKVMADERSQFVRLLSSLSRLGRVATRVINASVTSTQADFAELRPVVERIAAAGAALPESLDLLVDYPFPVDAAGSMPGDFANLYATVLGSPAGVCAVANPPPQLQAICKLLSQLPGPPAGPGGNSGGTGGLLKKLKKELPGLGGTNLGAARLNPPGPSATLPGYAALSALFTIGGGA